MKNIFYIFICLILFSATSVVAQSETEKGIDLYRNGDSVAAINILKNAIEIDKKDRKAWIYLGGCYVISQNYKLAAEAFKQADSLTPKKFSVEESIRFNDGLRITTKPRADYTDNARSAGTQGSVKLAVEYGADGKINFIFPVQTLPNGLTATSAEAAKKIKYEPAQKDGKPVKSIAITTYNFTIY